MATAKKHTAERQSDRMSKITNDGGLNPDWHRMLYSCTHMATVGVKGLIQRYAAYYFLYTIYHIQAYTLPLPLNPISYVVDVLQ